MYILSLVDQNINRYLSVLKLNFVLLEASISENGFENVGKDKNIAFLSL